nr:unnamed protein product [Callosobruchus analis]
MPCTKCYSSLRGDIRCRYDENVKLTDGGDHYALSIVEVFEDISF